MKQMANAVKKDRRRDYYKALRRNIGLFGYRFRAIYRGSFRVEISVFIKNGIPTVGLYEPRVDFGHPLLIQENIGKNLGEIILKNFGREDVGTQILFDVLLRNYRVVIFQERDILVRERCSL